MTARNSRSKGLYSSWEPLADWYDGWMGSEGSLHHRKLAIPTVMELLAVKRGEQILDVGAGQGVLAPYIAGAHASYTGVDASTRLLQLARKHHGDQGRFILGDARKLHTLPGLRKEMFDAAVFLLSIQDMDPLPSVLESVAWMLRGGGRVVILMTHPCFRIPRQSGWGWLPERQVQYRRIDRYLTPLSVPMKTHAKHSRGVTISFHRPLQQYVNSMAACGLMLDHMKEITTYKSARMDASSNTRNKAEETANQEIPLFLGLRARKI